MFDNLNEQINSLNRKAVTAYKQGQYEQGIKFAKQACELGKSAFGENHPDYA
ncbi:tetratricopeptide repeat protein, partial [Phormidium pseudopriestleyi]|uniref:tetratricopeptide repeat protein n=1 Tax=Phormidium pseudopriestleyi TaxID=1759527 RepID=UPI003BF48FBC